MSNSIIEIGNCLGMFCNSKRQKRIEKMSRVNKIGLNFKEKESIWQIYDKSYEIYYWI